MNFNSVLQIAVVWIALLAVVYFLMIRPQQKRAKETQSMRESLKVGDAVTTIGGITGVVERIYEEKIILRSSDTTFELRKWGIGKRESLDLERDETVIDTDPQE